MEGESTVKPCPYCAETVQEDSQVCPFCNTNLASPANTNAETSGKAIASLVCGILCFALPAAIVAVIMGHLSLSDIRRSAGRIRGRGVAISGLVLGYIGLSLIPVLIIAAIAIPNLLRSKMAANEASAVGSVRSYNYAMGAYAAKCPQIGFPRSLANLGPGGGDCDRAQLLDNSLGTSNPTKSGYVFSYKAGEPDHLGQLTSFAITADPVGQAVTGLRHFYTDQSGEIRSSETGPADGTSPLLQ
jgi:hypothetical protein